MVGVEGRTGLLSSAHASPTNASPRQANAALVMDVRGSLMAGFGASTRTRVYPRHGVRALSIPLGYASIRPAGFAHAFRERDHLARQLLEALKHVRGFE